jgi:hypothetical protein
MYPAGVTPSAGAVIANRYRLESAIGSGTYGEVWRAIDLVLDSPVAIKILREPEAPSERARARREAAALRLLRAPGIVQLLDEGEHDGRAFFAMEMANGAPFPARSRPCPWAELEPVAVALLETLERIHAAGIVHRDLKPSNVLVDDAGRLTVLDFGLARRIARNDKLTSEGFILGTPAYLAPEQIRGAPVVAQTDLYAAGVMLYEALADRLPHEAPDVRAVLRNRLLHDAASLEAFAPATPPGVIGVIERLLEREIEKRPRSARAALEALRGHAPSKTKLPWIGSRAFLDEAVDAVERGESVHVVGWRGSGRTRFLEELSHALATRTIEARFVGAGESPFASLVPIVGALAPEEGTPGDRRTLDEVRGEVGARLRRALAAGSALLVDDLDRIDAFSREALVALGPHARVVFARTDAPRESGTVSLEPFDVASLSALFTGQERVLRLQSDAARVLFERTGGIAAHVSAELAAWVRTGIAHADGERFRLSRESIDALEAGAALIPIARATEEAPTDLPAYSNDLAAWIDLLGESASVEQLSEVTSTARWQVEAAVEDLARHRVARMSADATVRLAVTVRVDDVWAPDRVARARRRLVEVLPPGSHGRLFHLTALANSTGLELAREAYAAAEAAYKLGRTSRAITLIEEALRFLREPPGTPARGIARPVTGSEERELRTLLFTRWFEIASTDQSVGAADRLLYELSRAGDDARGHELAELGTAFLELSTDPRRSLDRLARLGPLETPELERRRCAIRMVAARSASVELEEQVLDDIVTRARGESDAETAALEGWRGRLAYRKGSYAAAARHHEIAARLQQNPVDRIAARLNAASALVEAFQLEAALALALECRDTLAHLRHPVFTLRAEWLVRVARYRSGERLEADHELVAAADELRLESLTASVALREAAFAFRAGDAAVARRLALKAERSWRNLQLLPELAVLARALAISNGEPASEIEAVTLMRSVIPSQTTGVSVQALGLLAPRFPTLPAQLTITANELARTVPEEHWAQPIDVLSVNEALGAVDRARVS